MWVDRIIGDLRTAQTAGQFAAVFGAKPQWSTLADRIGSFNTALESEPPELDEEEAELRAALGLRSGRG